MSDASVQPRLPLAVKAAYGLADMGINMGLQQTMGLAAMMNPLSWANRYKVILVKN